MYRTIQSLVRQTILASALFAALGGIAVAQEWPTKPVRFIVSSAAGGPPDIVCRIIADQLSRNLGQQFIVDNRPGGANSIGAQAAARSAPDGYTFFFASAAALVSNPYTFKTLPYNPSRDFIPVAKIAEGPFVFLAHPSVKANTLAELIALAKAEPGKLTFASSGKRSFSGMLITWLNKLADIDILQIPYVQTPQAAQDAIAGRVQLTVLALPLAAPHIASGKLRPLAVSTAKRAKGYETIPTMTETLPELTYSGWFALVAPTGTPAEIVQRVNREMDKVLGEPEVNARLQKLGFYTDGADTPEATGAYIRREYELWAKIVKDIGLEPE